MRQSVFASSAPVKFASHRRARPLSRLAAVAGLLWGLTSPRRALRIPLDVACVPTSTMPSPAGSRSPPAPLARQPMPSRRGHRHRRSNAEASSGGGHPRTACLARLPRAAACGASWSGKRDALAHLPCAPPGLRASSARPVSDDYRVAAAPGGGASSRRARASRSAGALRATRWSDRDERPALDAAHGPGPPAVGMSDAGHHARLSRHRAPRQAAAIRRLLASPSRRVYQRAADRLAGPRAPRPACQHPSRRAPRSSVVRAQGSAGTRRTRSPFRARRVCAWH